MGFLNSRDIIRLCTRPLTADHCPDADLSSRIWFLSVSTRAYSRLRFERLQSILQLVKFFHFLRG